MKTAARLQHETIGKVLPFQPAAKGNKNAGEKQLIFLSPDVLALHPRNLRRFYPEKDILEMSISIRTTGGVYQALLIVPRSDKPGHYFVVDGNVRLSGARLLGKDSPNLKCEVISATEAEQMLAMAVTAKFRYKPDPISEALHYRRLQNEEGYNVQQIVNATGIGRATIDSRLRLLDLNAEIQELVAKRELPSNVEATEAFLSISNEEARIKLAQRMAHDGASVKTIIASCKRLEERLQEQYVKETPGKTAVDLAQQKAGVKTLSEKKPVKWSKVRMAAQNVCKPCDIRLSILEAAPEPAWTLIAHAAGETCGNCQVREVKAACHQCPAVEIIRQLILIG